MKVQRESHLSLIRNPVSALGICLVIISILQFQSAVATIKIRLFSGKSIATFGQDQYHYKTAHNDQWQPKFCTCSRRLASDLSLLYLPHSYPQSWLSGCCRKFAQLGGIWPFSSRLYARHGSHSQANCPTVRDWRSRRCHSLPLLWRNSRRRGCSWFKQDLSSQRGEKRWCDRVDVYERLRRSRRAKPFRVYGWPAPSLCSQAYGKSQCHAFQLPSPFHRF